MDVHPVRRHPTGGSRTIGSNAGLNLFHEFEPGLRRMMRGHGPKVESDIEERIKNDQPPRQDVPTPAK
jgi:hypothetical protein